MPIFGTIISAKLATLHEIKTIYTYEECLDLLYIVYVNNYNEHVVYNHSINKKA